MRKIVILYILLSSLIINAQTDSSTTVTNDCKYKGIVLKGKVKIVDNFEDIRVKIVDSFEDIDIEYVKFAPTDCGQWQIVDEFEDIRIKIVDEFEDVRIRIVDKFPGIP